MIILSILCLSTFLIFDLIYSLALYVLIKILEGLKTLDPQEGGNLHPLHMLTTKGKAITPLDEAIQFVVGFPLFSTFNIASETL